MAIAVATAEQANWVLGHTDRFKCIVRTSVFNAESFWGSTDELVPNWEFNPY